MKRNSTEQIINRYLTEMKGYMEPAGLKCPAMQTFADAGVESTESTKVKLMSLR